MPRSPHPCPLSRAILTAIATGSALNKVADAIQPNSSWRKPTAQSKRALRPGVCSNWDKEMQTQLTAELKEQGIHLDALDDVEAARRVSKWLMDRSQFEDSFTKVTR